MPSRPWAKCCLSLVLNPLFTVQGPRLNHCAEWHCAGLRVDLGTATFYLQNAKGDIRQAVSLHQQDVTWDRARPR